MILNKVKKYHVMPGLLIPQKEIKKNIEGKREIIQIFHEGIYLGKHDGHKECPKKVICHLKHLFEHGLRKWQLSDHQQGLLRIEETGEVTAAAAAAAAGMKHTIHFTFWEFLWIFQG